MRQKFLRDAYNLTFDKNDRLFYMSSYTVHAGLSTYSAYSQLRDYESGDVLHTFARMSASMRFDKDNNIIIQGHTCDGTSHIYRISNTGIKSIIQSKDKNLSYNETQDYLNTLNPYFGCIRPLAPLIHEWSIFDDASLVYMYNYALYYMHDKDKYKLTSDTSKNTEDGTPSQLAHIELTSLLQTDHDQNIYFIDDSNYDRKKIRVLKVLPLYQSSNALLETIIKVSNQKAYVFDNLGYHLRTINPQNNTILETFEYDEDYNLLSITDIHQNKIVFNHNSDGTISSIIAPNGDTTYLDYDSQDNLANISYDDGRQYILEHTNDKLTYQMTPTDKEIVSAYNKYGDLQSQTNTENNSYTVTKNISGTKTTTSINNNGAITTHTYEQNATGAIQTTSYPYHEEKTITKKSNQIQITECGMSTTYDMIYDNTINQNQISKITKTTPSGLKHTIIVEKEGNTTTKKYKWGTNQNFRFLSSVYQDATKTVKTNMYGKKITIHKNSKNQIQKLQAYDFYPIEYEYQDNGQISSLTQNDRVQNFTYNTKNLLSKTTDTNHTTSYTYNSYNHLTTINQEDITTSFTRDALGSLVSLATPLDKVYAFTRNTNSQPIQKSTPSNKTTNYTYNNQGKLIKINTPSNKNITYSYQDTRISQIQYPSQNISYAYHCGYLPSQIQTPEHTTTYSYDGTLLTDIHQGTNHISYTYNNYFLPSSVSYLDKTDTIEYSNLQPSKIGDISLSYNPVNTLLQDFYTHSRHTYTKYNKYASPQNTRTQINSNRFKTTSYYNYNNQGEITKISTTTNGINITKEYTYDSHYRLAQYFKNGVLIKNYSYDVQGNLDTHTVNEDSQTVIHTPSLSSSATPSLSNLTGQSQSSYTYTDDGYLQSKTTTNGTTTYHYNLLGELKKVVLPNGDIITYTHDTNHQVTSKSINGIMQYRYLWLDLTTLLGVQDVDGHTLMRFDYGVGRLPVSLHIEGDVYHMVYDQVGSLSYIVDDTGHIRKAVEYMPYGEVVSDSNASFYVPFGFAGGFSDVDTGLVRFGYRDYDPSLHKWTSADPVGFDGGDTNLYNYVGNDPVNFIDPRGEWSILGVVGFIISAYVIYQTIVKVYNVVGTIYQAIVGTLDNYKADKVLKQAYDENAPADVRGMQAISILEQQQAIHSNQRKISSKVGKAACSSILNAGIKGYLK